MGSAQPSARASKAGDPLPLGASLDNSSSRDYRETQGPRATIFRRGQFRRRDHATERRAGRDSARTGTIDEQLKPPPNCASGTSSSAGCLRTLKKCLEIAGDADGVAGELNGADATATPGSVEIDWTSCEPAVSLQIAIPSRVSARTTIPNGSTRLF